MRVSLPSGIAFDATATAWISGARCLIYLGVANTTPLGGLSNESWVGVAA